MSQGSQNAVIVGIDEAGRGALAGPVVAGAVLQDPLLQKRRYIKDSKLLLPEQRETSFEWITAHLPFGVGVVDAQYIDEHGILAATELSMQRAVAMLAEKITPTYLLVDGRDHFWFDYPHTSIIRGDQSEKCISAASIVAKVTRDRLMMQYSKTFSEYCFDQHKGYGTALHYECLIKHGSSELHRKSYLQTFYSSNSTSFPVQPHTNRNKRKSKQLTAA